MDLVAVGQAMGQVSLENYAALQKGGPIVPPAMTGLGELLHRLKLDDDSHNPFVNDAPVRTA